MAVAVIASSPQSAIAWGSDDSALAQEIAALLHIGAGSKVAEIGAGEGEMTARMAAIVGPSGHVYATEIDPDRLDDIRARVSKLEFRNVTVIEATAADQRLPAGCCDAAYMIGVYHHVTDPAATDRSIVRALRPGAMMLVNDFFPSWWLSPWTPEGIPANRGGHGISDEIVIEEMRAAGLELVEDKNPWHAGFFLKTYCLIFRKPASAPAP